MADKTNSYPRFSRPLRQDMVRLIGQIGVGAFAAKVGVTPSAVHRWLQDPNCGAQRTTIAKVVAIVGGPQKANGHANGEAAPPDGMFELRVKLGVRRAERLVAHCELHGITMSALVAQLIDEKLDAVWGKEAAS